MRNKILLAAIFGGTLILFPSTSPYDAEYVPIYMDYKDLHSSVSYKVEARPLTEPGKIYYKAPYIYINEKYKGIHIINNSEPEHPVNEGFILVPGCLDMAIKDNIIYMDNSVDLVAFDLNTKQVTNRINRVFPEPIAPGSYKYLRYDSSKVIVAWKKTEQQ